MRQRRFLPNMSLLLAFDAVMREKSVTLAAQEIGLTQSTVSRLIQSLEAQLGLVLFIRRKKQLIATEAAHRYFTEIAPALDQIQRASMGLLANPEGGSLDLAVLPTFGTRWLAPRLPHFFASHPGVAVNLTTRFSTFDFASEPFDAMIYFGQGHWQGAGQLKLFDETLTACASPAYLRENPITRPADLKGKLLLQLATRPTAWEDWFKGQGARLEAPVQNMWLDQFSMMIAAAISGLGLALLPDYLARTEIAEGRLCPLLTPAVPSSGSYWLAWPEARGDHLPLKKFRDWLAPLASGANHP